VGALRERYESIAKRVADLSPVVEPIRELFKQGKRTHLLAGVSAQGLTYAPPAPATIARRGPGTVLVPHGDESRLLTHLTIAVNVSPTKLEVFQSWPGLDWVHYHTTGTDRMPARPPDNFRVEDRVAALRLVEAHAFGLPY